MNIVATYFFVAALILLALAFVHKNKQNLNLFNAISSASSEISTNLQGDGIFGSYPRVLCVKNKENGFYLIYFHVDFDDENYSNPPDGDYSILVTPAGIPLFPHEIDRTKNEYC